MRHILPPLPVAKKVSMKSGLEGRNNPIDSATETTETECLNEVRPRRPEQ